MAGNRRRICVVTGTRAEYGLLSRLMRMVADSPDCALQIIATNMHLSPEFGLTYREIESDGFRIDKKVEMLLSSDTANGTVKSMGLATVGFADALEDLRPDLAVILGDRYEMLCAAQACLIYRIPVAHLYGGEITEGAYDDAIRHAITKMSHLHFTSTERYRRRIIQLGEQPGRVFNVGSLGVENIRRLPLLGKEETERSIGFRLDGRTVLVTFHPATLGGHAAEQDIREFTAALEERPGLRIVFTMPNSDTGGGAIADAVGRFVTRHPDRACAFKSLGVQRYLSVMRQAAAVAGNSSSGLLEAPSFGVPTLNIGDRQRGRISCGSVWNCAPDRASILAGLDKVLSPEFRALARTVRNPYEKENTARSIFEVISACPLGGLDRKHFYDMP